MAGVEIVDSKMIDKFLADHDAFISYATGLFDQLDTDGDGRVTKDQLLTAFDGIFCSSEDDDNGGAATIGRPVTKSELFQLFNECSRAVDVGRNDFVRGLAFLMGACAESFDGTPMLAALHGEAFSLLGPAVEHDRFRATARLG